MLWRKEFRIDTFFLCVILLFWSFPTKFTLGMGQINVVALVFLLASFFARKYHHSKWSGILFALAVLAKPQLGGLLIPLVLTKQWRMIFWFFVMVSMSIGVSFLLFGYSPLDAYVHIAIPEVSKFSGRDIYANQSISSFFPRFLSLPLAELGTKIGSFVFLGLGIVEIIRKKYFWEWGMLLFLPLLLIVQPITWQHHLVFLFPPFIFLSQHQLRKKEWVALLIAYILISTNIPLFDHWYPASFFAAVIRSHALWGSFLLFFCILRYRHQHYET
jgi:hypothetical protein